jgi:ATP-binding cassette subfamily B protein
MFIKSTISKSSHIVNDNQNLIIKIIQDSLGSIKEILLSRSYKVFTKEFSKASIEYKMAQSLLQIISNLPKLIIEPSVMLLFIISLYFFKDSIDLASFVVVFLGLIRVLPSFQVVYYNFQTFYNGLPSIIEFYNLLIKSPINYDNPNDLLSSNFSKIEFKSVNYKIDEKEIISNLNLELYSGQKIGIYGKSGSGKSTFIDLLMGLINPSTGAIIIDGKTLESKLKNSWFSKIGHVKQDVFLIDDTIKKNIAFGIEDELIDNDKVLNSLKLAGLEDFIADLELGIDSLVGENGAFVSGGQRQRMGLARLFYFNKKIIVLDEATSALDYKTEASILEKIYSLEKEYTIIMISHREETLKKCDVVLEFPLK